VKDNYFPTLSFLFFILKFIITLNPRVFLLILDWKEECLFIEILFLMCVCNKFLIFRVCMCTWRSFRVFKEGFFFSCLWLVVFTHNDMETRKNTNGDVVVFMALKFLCLLLFGMCMLLWILLNVGWLCGKGATKWSVAGGNLVVEQ